jgi:TatD DNase family protein
MINDSIRPAAVVDAHCHIDLYKDSVAMAQEVERRRVHTIAVTNAPSVFFFTADLAAKGKYLHAAAGLHPELVRTHGQELPQLLSLLEKTSFVGEIGLDFVTTDTADRKRQIDTFEIILQRCAELGKKVLTIHSRRSSAQVVKMIERTNPGISILHWFSGPVHDLRKAIDIGCWFSVNPAMILSQNGRSLIAAMPRERVVTESDGPFVEINGHPVTPWDTDAVLVHLATVWKCSAEDAATTVVKNFHRLVSGESFGR